MRGSKNDLPKTVDEQELTIWETDWGDIHVSLITCHEELDISPVLRGLPEDMCQCPHWGMILKGRKLVRYKDREEVLTGGDAYYMEPGHTTLTDAGTEWLEFSPSDALKKTNDAVARNLHAMNRG
jgi:hypothetical protein